MSEEYNFLNELESAIEAKRVYLETKVLPDVLDNFHLLHTCTKSLYELLEQRSLIKPDPYKTERKISKIVIPEDTAFVETDRATVIGARFSDYESMIDYVCTYLKFTVDALELPRIKQLSDLVNHIDWNNLSSNNAKVNTRSLADIINEARSRANGMTASLISDAVSKSANAASAITKSLRELTVFHKEFYKYQIRKTVIANPDFKKESLTSPQEELAEVRRLFPQLMGKKSFYGDLVQEIIKEDQNPDKLQLREKIFVRLELPEQKKSSEKKEIDTKELLIEAVMIISSLAPQYEQVNAKVNANHELLASTHNSFFDKIRRAIRKAFNLQEPKEMYELVITNQKTDLRTQQKIEYHAFYENIERKKRVLSSFNGKQSAEFHKIESSTEDAILNFINKQISDNQEIIVLLNALDDYFKEQIKGPEKERIKGMKIELVTMKNTVIKANQKRAEYVSVVEEKSQMKKMGVKNEN
ncbi:MAG: hypothetical protein IJR49_02640 [Treponema sp.]|nr:hypothetical protein [Treponema sp.]